MSQTVIHGFYMPKEYRKTRARKDLDSHFKLGHDEAKYYLTQQRQNDLGDLGAQYKAIRQQMTPKISQVSLQAKLSANNIQQLL